MKTLKSLLWFIIPLVVVILLLVLPFFIALFGDLFNILRFIGPEQYLRLMLNDTLYLWAMFNTFLLLFSICAFFAVIFVIIRFLIKKYKKKTIGNAFYPISLVILTLISYVFQYIMLIRSYTFDYAVETIMAHLTEDYIPPRISIINTELLLVSLIAADIACLLVWIADKIILKRSLKRKEQTSIQTQ